MTELDTSDPHVEGGIVSDFAMRISQRLREQTADITLTLNELARLSEYERKVLGKTALKQGWVEYRNPALPDAIKLIRNAPDERKAPFAHHSFRGLRRT